MDYALPDEPQSRTNSRPLPQKSDILVYQGSAFRKQRDLQLRHGRGPGVVDRGFGISCYHKEIRLSCKPVAPPPESRNYIYSYFKWLRCSLRIGEKCRGQEV